MAVAIRDEKLASELAEMKHQLAQLRAVAEASLQVVIKADRTQAMLGQTIGLTVTVRRGLDGHPLPGVVVALVSDGGPLRGREGLRIRQGRSLTVTTDSYGKANVSLLPQSAEPLTTAQRAALDSALSPLDTTSASPEAMRSALDELVKQYRWKPAVEFRTAVDILLTNRRKQLADPVNRRNPMSDWTTTETAVLAHVVDAPTLDGYGRGSGMTAIRFLDWLAPWFHRFRHADSLRTRLLDKLTAMNPRDFSDSSWLAVMKRGTEGFLREEEGRIGKHIAGLTANGLVQEITQQQLANLPKDRRLRLGGHLHNALDPVRGLRIDRLSMAATVEHTSDGGRGGVKDLEGRLEGISAALAGKADQSRLDTLDAQTNTRFTAFTQDLNNKAPLSRVESLQSELTSELNDMGADLAKKANRTELVTLREGIGLGDANPEVPLLRQVLQLQEAVNTKADKAELVRIDSIIREDLQDLRTDIGLNDTRPEVPILTDLGRLRTDVAGKADLTLMRSFRQDLERDTQSLRSQLRETGSHMERLQANVQTRVDGFSNQLEEQQIGLGKVKIELRESASNWTEQFTTQAQLVETVQSQTQGSLQALTDAVNTKADQDSLSRVQTSFNQQQNDVRRRLNDKADVTDLNGLKQSLTRGLNAKADASQFKNFQEETTNALKQRVTVKAFSVLRNTVNRNFDALSSNVRNFDVLDPDILHPTEDTILTPIDRGGGIIFRPDNQ